MIKMGSAVKKITFQSGTLRILETYELGGIQIQSMSLPWSPYLVQDNCQANGITCDSEGYLIDIVEMAGRLFNFTYVSLRDPNNDWGVTPKSGPYNRSGVWGGVMGGVVNGQFDMSLSAWQWVYNRQGCQMAKLDLFLSLDCARVEGQGGPVQGKEQVKFCSVA